jgi:formamidopyrimidine-DNA glycosylase
MPELPEVETVCRSLRPHLVEQTVERIEVLEPRLRVRVDETALGRLAGKTILEIRRAAKYILILLSEDIVWVFHLGMSGKLICVQADAPRRKHDHIIMHFVGGGELRYHDPRRFGLTLVTRKEILHELPQLSLLGIDPFDPDLTGEYLFCHTRASKRPIRDLLVDQRIIAGLGNIYANEILARVGIKPTARSSRLTRKQAHAIAQTVPDLLRQAIRWCGTSFSDYRDADDKRGEFQRHLRVYDREGETCRGCGSIIKRVAIGNRSAFYCPSCQK